MKQTFQFLSSNGHTQIKGYRWENTNKPFHAVLQMTHGMTEHMNRYDGFAEYMAEQGFLVVAHDHLGHGLSVEKPDDLGYFDPEHPSDTLIEDMHKLFLMTSGEFPDLPYFILGHSMGSYMLRKYLTRYSQGLSGAIVMGTGDVPRATCMLAMTLTRIMALFRSWRFRSRLMAKLSTGSGPYKQYCLDGSVPDRSWLTKDTEIVRRYYQDPLCTFTFTLNGYRGLFEAVLEDGDIENIRKIDPELPILLISGKEDPVGDMGEGVLRVQQKMLQAGLKKVTCRLYEGDRHEVLNELDREQVYQDLRDWLQEQISTKA